jgi:hypothetical protein
MCFINLRWPLGDGCDKKHLAHPDCTLPTRALIGIGTRVFPSRLRNKPRVSTRVDRLSLYRISQNVSSHLAIAI